MLNLWFVGDKDFIILIFCFDVSNNVDFFLEVKVSYKFRGSVVNKE